MSELVCPEPGCPSNKGTICRIHLLKLVPPSQRREPRPEVPDSADPGRSAGPAASRPVSCWHCDAPIPDPAATRCIQCAKPLIQVALTIEFSGGHVTVATGEQAFLGRAAIESPHYQLFAAYRNVSRLHATIGMDRSGAWIRDEESLNGTFVNDVPITQLERHPLADGDRVRLGATAAGRVSLRPPS